MKEIEQRFAESIISGLKRKSLVTCSRWAQKCRIMGKPIPGPFTFTYHPWLKEMHDTDCEIWVGQKAAQMGYTEVALNRTFFTIDVKRLDCLYILPSKVPDASNFSASRFDSALDLSPYLLSLFSEVKNIGHKKAGATNLFIRGSRSKSGLKSVPVGLLILDELEEMTRENIPLALERQSGQMERQTILLSTPRIAGRGINVYYEDSTKEHFFFKCPHCTRFTELIYPECLVITAESLNDPRINETHLICKECKGILEHQSKHRYLQTGSWVAGHTGRSMRGFYINQLYSSTESPVKIAQSFFRAQRDPTEEQEFYNSKLGLVHEVKGSRVLEEEILACIKEYTQKMQSPRGSIITMGVDQGRWIHYEIDLWHLPQYTSSTDINAEAVPRLLEIGKVSNFEDLDLLMQHWGMNACVIDAHPEKRKALEFAARFPGFVRLCIYGEGLTGKEVTEWTTEPTITVDRTAWMDAALGRFHHQSIMLPKDIGLEYRDHIKVPVRTYVRDRHGNAIGRYVAAENAHDHWAHARTYSEIALRFAVGMSQSHSVRSPR